MALQAALPAHISVKGRALFAYRRKQGGVWLKAKFVQLYHVEHNSPVTEESDPLFWRTLYTGLLLALQEQGILDHTQCQDALEHIVKHRAGKGSTR